MASLQHLHAQSADYANAADRSDIVETLAAAWSRQGAPRTAKDATDEDALGGARSALGEVESSSLKAARARANAWETLGNCLLYTSPSPRDRTRSRMPSSA